MLYLSLFSNKYDKLSETGAGAQSEAGPHAFTEKCFIYVWANVITPAHCLEVKTRDVSRVLRLIWTFVLQLWNAVEADKANTHCEFSAVKCHWLPLVLAS